MSTELLEQRSINISPEKFLAFVSEMIGTNVGREDDEHPTPPDRYASLVREALDRIPRECAALDQLRSQSGTSGHKTLGVRPAARSLPPGVSPSQVYLRNTPRFMTSSHAAFRSVVRRPASIRNHSRRAWRFWQRWYIRWSAAPSCCTRLRAP